MTNRIKGIIEIGGGTTELDKALKKSCGNSEQALSILPLIAILGVFCLTA